MTRQRLVAVLAMFLVSLLTSCASCGGFNLWGGTGCDNFLTPNWENRQAKFASWMNYEVGKPFPNRVMCNSTRYKNVDALSDGSVRYSYDFGIGCTYSCVVKDSKVISTSYHGGEGEQSCYLPLN